VPLGYAPTSAFGQETLTILLARLHGFAPYGSDFAYDKAFAQQECAKGLYERFANLGSYYCVSDHSFAFLGFGLFALSLIHGNHMPRLYGRLYLFALLMQTAQASRDAFDEVLLKRNSLHSPFSGRDVTAQPR